MNRSKTAKILTLNEIANMVRNPTDKPLVERMIWMDARATDKVPRTLLPCFVNDILERRDNGEVDGVHVTLVQWVKGEPCMIRVGIPAKDICGGGALSPGKGKCRFWNKPPKEDVMERYPFSDTEEQMIRKFEEQLEKAFDEADTEGEFT